MFFFCKQKRAYELRMIDWRSDCCSSDLNYVTRFNWHDRSYDVIAQFPQSHRLAPDDLGRFQVRTASGSLVPLATIASVEIRPQPNRLPQFNQMNSATLSAVLLPGVTMGQAVDFLQSQTLPEGTSRSEEHTSELQ